MIQEIHLENFLFMQKANLTFCQGLNVITGETGAGKSVLLEGVRLLLGKKVRSNIVLPGRKTAKVQAQFIIKTQPELKKLLETSGFINEDDPDALIISRIFKEDGTSKILVNGIMTTVSFIKQIGPYLMEIHGQNEHQTLLLPDTQRRYLDRTGNEEHLNNLNNLKEIFKQRQELQQKYLELKQRQQHSTQKIQELQEILQELEAMNLHNVNEEEELKIDLKKLSQADTILNMLKTAIKYLSGQDDTHGATSLSYKTAECLRRIKDYGPRFEEAEKRATSIFYELQELESNLIDLAESTELDPDRLYDIQARLADISRCCRKHKCDFKGLFDLKKSVNEELAELYEPDSSRECLRKALDEVNEKFNQIVDKISRQRKKLAKELEEKISKEMQYLGFNTAKFKVNLIPIIPGANGAEQIEFVVSLNPGAPEGPLRKIASGGELSRVALAIKKVLAQSDDLPTLIFDEIDAGIGGKTAEAVALSLRALAAQKQVILVTHLHQIAKEGALHFTVNKVVEKDATKVIIKQVDNEARIEEIARMLGHTDAEGLAFARNLLQKSD